MKNNVTLILTSMIMITFCSCGKDSGGRLPDNLSFDSNAEVESYFASSNLSDEEGEFLRRGIALHKNMLSYLDKNSSSYAVDAWMNYAGGRIDPMATADEWNECTFDEDKLTTTSVLMWSNIAKDIVNGGKAPNETALELHGTVTMFLMHLESLTSDEDYADESIYHLALKVLGE